MVLTRSLKDFVGTTSAGVTGGSASDDEELDSDSDPFAGAGTEAVAFFFFFGGTEASLPSSFLLLIEDSMMRPGIANRRVRLLRRDEKIYGLILSRHGL